MATKKASYNVDRALKLASKSGTATLIGTAKASGNYEIRTDKRAGTPVVLGAILASMVSKTTDKVPSSEFVSRLSEVSGDLGNKGKFLLSEISLYEKEKGKKYGNLKTLVSRIRSETNSGVITSFTFATPDSESVKALISRVKKSK